MEYKDYYKILEVSRDAGAKEVKQAYRKLARQYHPDANPDDPQAEERFKEINEAYEVLADPEKRKLYDQLGSDWSNWQRTGGRPEDFDWSRWGSGPQPNVRYGTPEDLQDLLGGGAFSDFFQQLFGGGRAGASGGFEDLFGGMGGMPRGGRARPQRGRDYEQPVEITLEEAFSGAVRLLQKDSRRLEIRIPPGADNGTRVRLSGEGGSGAAGSPAGDLYLVVSVQPHPRFERDGDDLRVTAPVDLYTAVLGGETSVRMLDGSAVMLRIPPETQNGRTFRLRGKGMPRLQQPAQRGDLYVTVTVDLPQQLTAAEREHFETLRALRE